jgi:TIR domain/Sel1 repeat
MSSLRSPQQRHEFDVFISYAVEDKDYVMSLMMDLEIEGIRVWVDAERIEWGDDIRKAIDRGLSTSHYGIVVFSPAFLRRKKWTEYELSGLLALERVGKKVILPIWHNITRDELLDYSPTFADRVAMDSTRETPRDMTKSLLAMLGRTYQTTSDQVQAPSTSTRSQVINMDEAILRAAAQGGDSRAQNTLGDFYRDIRQDVKEALRWYRKAADQGLADAQCNIGHFYSLGVGVEQDYHEAMKWFSKASSQGFAPAQYNIGNHYASGQGVAQDYGQAHH